MAQPITLSNIKVADMVSSHELVFRFPEALITVCKIFIFMQTPAV